MNIYLAGPINGCSDAEANDWRDDLTARLPGHNIISPMVRDYRGKEDENVADIIRGDKEDIRKSHVVVAHCPKPSVGTSMEVYYAWAKDKAVVVYIPESVSVSPWLRFHSDAVVHTPEDVVAFINSVSVLPVTPPSSRRDV